LFSLGYREKAVPNIDIWHAHLKSSLEEPSHPTLHKFISISVLWPIAEILHVSFSVPESGWEVVLYHRDIQPFTAEGRYPRELTVVAPANEGGRSRGING
jgi:hypothetical protein